jgi:hypothetical protein
VTPKTSRQATCYRGLRSLCRRLSSNVGKGFPRFGKMHALTWAASGPGRRLLLPIEACVKRSVTLRDGSSAAYGRCDPPTAGRLAIWQEIREMHFLLRVPSCAEAADGRATARVTSRVTTSAVCEPAPIAWRTPDALMTMKSESGLGKNASGCDCSESSINHRSRRSGRSVDTGVGPMSFP